MIQLKPDELETVAKHIPDAEDVRGRRCRGNFLLSP